MNGSVPAALLLAAKVTVVLAAGLTAAHVARRTRAAVRHLLLAATFVVAIGLPAASMFVPDISLSIPIAIQANAPSGAGNALMEEPSTAVDVASDRRTAATPRPSNPSAVSWWWATIIWLAGVSVSLLALIVGLWQVRSLRRSGQPWAYGQSIADRIAADAGIRQHVEVLLHRAISGPLTFGIVRPAVLLPIAATTWNDDDLSRAMVHELEHIRRGDWASQCVARLVCALYWCQPLVWIAWRRFVVEAERACDDAVLRRSEPTAYADQLVALATQLSAARQPLLAMANRADLSTRVVAVLNRHQARGRAGRTWIVSAMAAAVLLLVTVSPLRLVAAPPITQTPANAASSEKQRYDVVSIKPCVAEEVPTGARGTVGGTNATYSPGRFRVPCVTTEQLIYLAYAAQGAREDERLANDDLGTASNATKIRGGPDWVHSLKNKYEIEATAPASATDRTVLMGAMLRTLLEERFKLTLHRETEEVPLFELTVAKGGLKLKPMKDGDCTPNPRDGSPVDMNAEKPRCGNLMMVSSGALTRWVFGGMTLDSLAHSLSSRLKTHVIDRTNIADQFVIKLDFELDDLPARAGSATGGGSEVRPQSGDAMPRFPSLTDALAALGLKLDKTKGPRGYLVIDHIERPTPDGPSAIPPTRAAGPGVRR